MGDGMCICSIRKFGSLWVSFSSCYKHVAWDVQPKEQYWAFCPAITAFCLISHLTDQKSVCSDSYINRCHCKISAVIRSVYFVSFHPFQFAMCNYPLLLYNLCNWYTVIK
jgi:hypothetical protein